jgi:outer membrane usher protein
LIFFLILLFTQVSYGQEENLKTSSDRISEKLLQGVDTKNKREFTEQELMEKFFNKKGIKGSSTSNSSSSFLMPIYYESMSRPLSQIKSRGFSKVGGVDGLEVDIREVVEAIKLLIDKDAFDKIKKIENDCEEKINKSEAKDDVCWNPVSLFNDPDIKVLFDESRLELRIKIDPKIRATKVTSLTRNQGYEEDITNTPSWFSSYVNINAGQIYQSNNLAYKNGRLPLTAYYDSATRFGELVIEARAHSIEKRPELNNSSPSFARDDLRAVYDFTSINSRSQVGDLTYPVRGYQIYRPLAGVSLFTQTNMQGSLLTTPGNNYEINLIRPSKINIYINDKLVQTLELAAGRHDLRDFPFSNRQNELKIEIIDDLGRSEFIQDSILITNELLNPREHSLSYTSGVPWTENNGERIYDSKKSMTSVFHRYGFAQQLTLGANYQKDDYQSILGFEFLFSTPIGYFSIEPSYSKNEDHPDGYAGAVRYVLEDLQNKEKRNKVTSFEVRTESVDFARLGIREPSNISAVNLRAVHTRALSEKSSLNLNINYDVNRQTQANISDGYSIGVGNSYRWIDGLTTNFSFRHTRGSTGTEEISVLLFLVWSQPKQHQFITVSSESSSGSSRADWTYQPNSGVGGYRSRLNVQNKTTGNGYGGEYEYNGNRTRMSAAHQIEVIKANPEDANNSKSKSIHSSNLQYGTALVFAGGRFAVTRPVFDSFVIFDPLANVKNENIQINPQKNGVHFGESDFFGPAVLPELPSYSVSNIIIKQKSAAKGLALPKDHFTLRPSYHAGYAIPIGTDATVYLKTRLINPDGSPGSMLVGSAIYADEGLMEPVTIFTNKSGLLRSEGFRRGRFKLVMSDDQYEPIEFEIPSSATDEFEIPSIQLKARKK